MSLCSNNKELQLGTKDLMENHMQVLRNKGKEVILLRRGCWESYHKQKALTVGVQNESGGMRIPPFGLLVSFFNEVPCH